MTRLLLLLLIVLIFSAAWIRYREIPLLVIGQPTSTGLMQGVKEEPFFNHLRATTRLPFQVTYKPLNTVGLKDNYQLPMLKEGIFDLVSLRFIQNSEIEPSLQGIDMVGLYTDYATARQGVRNYAQTVDTYLRDTFDAKLLGVWTFGPQVFFCRKPVRNIGELRGLKVRVASGSMATVMEALGATPAIIPYDDTKNALAISLVDCAITSAASANFAGWPEHTQYFYPLAVHFGLNGYALSMKQWKALSHQEQATLQATFDDYLEDLWRFSEATSLDAARCNTGQECKAGKPYHMTLVNPSRQDVLRLREIMQDRLIPEWGEKCEKVHPGCRREWLDKVFVLAH